MGLLEKVFGDLNKKEVRKIEKIVDKIEALDEEMQLWQVPLPPEGPFLL